MFLTFHIYFSHFLVSPYNSFYRKCSYDTNFMQLKMTFRCLGSEDESLYRKVTFYFETKTDMATSTNFICNYNLFNVFYFVVTGFQCETGVHYPTKMDGIHQWGCVRYNTRV